MSAAATAWAWAMIARGRVQTAAGRLVLLKLADRADDQGKCWPGHERTAGDCNISVRAAHDAHAALERAGLVVVERRQDISGRDLANVYRLPIFAGGEGAEFAPPPANSAGRSAKSAPESNKTNLKEDLYACTEPPKAVREVHAKKTVAQKVTPTQTKKPDSRKGAPRLPPVGADGKFKYPYSENGIECWTPDDLQKTKNLIFEFGEQAVSETIKKIAGDGRKPFPSSIFKLLKGKENENCCIDFTRNGFSEQGGVTEDRDPFDAAAERSRDRWAARARARG